MQTAQSGWRGVGVYLALAFGLSWPAQVLLALATRGAATDAVQAVTGNLLITAALLMWPPALGAWAARRFVEHGGLEETGLRWCDPRWLLVAWLGPPALVLLAMALSLPIYPLDPNLTTMHAMIDRTAEGASRSPEQILLLQVVFGLTAAVLFNSVFTLGEELGWRGYLLPRLMARLGAWPGLLAHGAIWGLWHAPIIATLGYNYPGHPALGVPMFVVACTLMGVLFGWLRLASGSLIPPTIAHAALNAVGALPLLLLVPGIDATVAGTLWSPVGWIALLLAILCLWASGALRGEVRTRPTTQPRGGPRCYTSAQQSQSIDHIGVRQV